VLFKQIRLKCNQKQNGNQNHVDNAGQAILETLASRPREACQRSFGAVQTNLARSKGNEDAKPSKSKHNSNEQEDTYLAPPIAASDLEKSEATTRRHAPPRKEAPRQWPEQLTISAAAHGSNGALTSERCRHDHRLIHQQ
jgi:hypothetical protein